MSFVQSDVTKWRAGCQNGSNNKDQDAVSEQAYRGPVKLKCGVFW